MYNISLRNVLVLIRIFIIENKVILNLFTIFINTICFNSNLSCDLIFVNTVFIFVIVFFMSYFCVK